MECSNIQISASIMKILKEHVGEIYCVELVKKENTGFGFLLRQSDDMPFFTVWEIVKNGSAEKNGKIKKGDIILKVNEHDLTMVTYEKGLEILKSIKAGQNAQFTLLSVNQQRFDKTNGIISPLQKIKRKFIRYTSGTSTSHNNISNGNNAAHYDAKLYFSGSSKIPESNTNFVAYEEEPNSFLKSPATDRKNTTSTHGLNTEEIKPLQNTNSNNLTNSFDYETERKKYFYSNQTLPENENSKYHTLTMNSETISDFNRLRKNVHDQSFNSLNECKSNELAKYFEDKRDLLDLLSREYAIKREQSSKEAELEKKIIANFLTSLALVDRPKPPNSNTCNSLRVCEAVDNSVISPEPHYESAAEAKEILQPKRTNKTEANSNLLAQTVPNTILTLNANREISLNETKNAQSQSISINPSISNDNQNGALTSKNKIQIFQEGDDLRINIDDNIEIFTNRTSDKRVISLSPQCTRKFSNINPIAEKERQNEPLYSTIKTDVSLIPKLEEENEKEKEKEKEKKKEIEIEEEKAEQLKPKITKKELHKQVSIETHDLNKTSRLSSEKQMRNDLAVKVASLEVKQEEMVKKESPKNETLEQPLKLSQTITKPVKTNEKSNLPTSKTTSDNNEKQAQINSTVSNSNSLALESLQNKKVKKKGLKLKCLLDDSSYLDTLHHNANMKVACTSERCVGSILQVNKLLAETKNQEVVLQQAVDFINQFYASVKREGSKTHKERLEEIIESIKSTGTYELKETELCFGARTAWRNAPRCIGRIQWSKLQVFDARFVTTARGMFEAICNHLKYVTNKGNIRSAITIFRQRTQEGHDFRVWNSQFVNYAGYKIDENTVIGDRAQIEFTEICIKLGWKPKYKEFEVLPLVLQANGQDPEWFEIPHELIMEVNIVHPKYDWFADLQLKWYCVPAVASMMLDAGGIEFTAAPFNGWYMSTEIARNFSDTNRFNKLPLIAERMGLDIKNNSSLWKDKALIELNHAVLYTYQKTNVTILDHHTASESFMKHYENENKLRGGCPADWVWIVPAISGHITPVFHLEMLNYNLKPSYEYQDHPWRSHIWKQKSISSEDKSKRPKRRVYFSDIARAVKFSAKLMGKALAKRVKCTILYATETGKSERFAKSLIEVFKHAFDAKSFCMKDYDVVNLEHETLLLIVTSTFGNGDAPENGEEFKKIIIDMKKEQILLDKNQDQHANQSIYDNSGVLSSVRYAVFGLGNSSYPKFCSYAKFLDDSFQVLGAERIFKLGMGDELCGQEESFRKWTVDAFKSAVDIFCIDTDKSFIDSISADDTSWTPQTIRITPFESNKHWDLCEKLSKVHGRSILPCKLLRRNNLQAAHSGRSTLCVEMSTQGYSSELQYKSGDHIGILAANRRELVESILNKVTNAPPVDQLIKIEILKEKTTVFGVSKQWVVDERYPPCSLRDAFTYNLDITSPLTQNMLLYLSTQTTSDSDRVKLEKLAKDHIVYEQWKLNGYPNLAEVLDEFPSLRPNASLLLTQLPKLQPRFYSISSSPKSTDEIHLTVGVIEYKTKTNNIHYGVCSKWLEELDVGSIVPSYIRGAPSFRLPDDKTCPIIMIGAGTGIAPFRSFWQERKVEKEMMQTPKGLNGYGWGKMVLYFGCRQPGLDELYRNEIEELLKEDVIQSYHPAYSRVPNRKKVYVQDVLAENKNDIFDMIFNKQGHFYVCGDVRMAAGVTTVLETIIHDKGQMSLIDAKEYVNQMKDNLRFHEDIFGNSVNTSSYDVT